MLKPIYTGVLQALTLVDDVKKLKSGEKEIRQELLEIAQLVRDWRQEQIHDRDIAKHESENLLLRLENALLRAEHRSPAVEAKSKPTDDLRKRLLALERANEELRKRVEELERR